MATWTKLKMANTTATVAENINLWENLTICTVQTSRGRLLIF